MQDWLRALSILMVAGLATQRAAADIDLTGRWAVTTSFGSICVDIGQTGTNLSGTPCLGGTPYSGSLDLVTGVFTLAQPPGCGSFSIEATAAPDSASFAGLLDFSIFHCTFMGCSCITFDDNPVVGTRSACGDGIMLTDAGEQCDDGNTTAGDCCSPTCQFEPFGSPCVDADSCTIGGTCSGSGVCNGTPAPSGTPCRPAAGACDIAETCPGGLPICPADAFLPDGTACNDGDQCTANDQCAAGVCAGDVTCTDPFKCYRATDLENPAFAEVTVSLADEYANDSATVIKPQAVCNPASLGAAPLLDATAHLTCYKISEPALSTPVRIESGSVLGAVQLQLKKPALLCLPSTKTVLP